MFNYGWSVGLIKYGMLLKRTNQYICVNDNIHGCIIKTFPCVQDGGVRRIIIGNNTLNRRKFKSLKLHRYFISF